MTTISVHKESEISDFYQHIRNYWAQLSRSPQGDASLMLNFGYWPDGVEHLFDAQCRFIEEVEALLPPVTLGTLGLEIGCGIGGVSIKVLKDYPDLRMTALDISPIQLNISNQHAQDAGVSARMKTQQGDAMALPFAASSFDLTMCIESTFHYEDKAKFMQSNFKVLKPGGCTVLADITCEDNERVRFRQGNHFESRQTYIDLAQAAGFEVESVSDIGPRVFGPLYSFIKTFNQSQRIHSGKYWSVVLRNYEELCAQGLMGYHLFRLKKPL
jgi:SAM-dependent methyltransferase